MSSSTKPSVFIKFIYAILSVASAVWFGSSVARYAVGFDVFEPGTAVLREIPQEQLLNTIRIASNISAYTLGAYAVVLVCGLLVSFLNRMHFKKRGFLFMAFVLLTLCAPIELYLGYIDYCLFLKFPSALSINGVDTQSTINLFMQRFITYSPFGFLSFLGHATALGILAWKPLDAQK